MRTVSSLLTLGDQVWVKTRSVNIHRLFLEMAEKEGFTFRDGTMPTEGEVKTDIFVLHDDWTIGCAGWAGHMAFHNPGAVIGGPMIRVDFGHYLAGRDDFVV